MMDLGFKIGTVIARSAVTRDEAIPFGYRTNPESCISSINTFILTNPIHMPISIHRIRLTMKTLALACLVPLLLLRCKHENRTPTDTDSIPSLKAVATFQTALSEPSGLAYNAKNSSLMTVSDQVGAVYEISFDGTILHTTPIQASDLEAIALSESTDTIFVVEESRNAVTAYSSDNTKLFSFPVEVATEQNHSLEGITIGPGGHLFVINEKAPCMLLEFNGTAEVFRKELTYTTDVSDLTYDKSENCLWVVSDESMKVLKLTLTGVLLAEYRIPFTKGEGIAVVHDRIYIINDANGRLYVFEKP